MKNLFVLMLSASYWRFRKQQENHSESLFWAKLVVSMPLYMLTISSFRWLVQTSDYFQTLRAGLASSNPVLVPGLWLLGWLLLHRFIRVNNLIYTEKLLPEAYRNGNNYTYLFLATSSLTTVYTFLTLGAF